MQKKVKPDRQEYINTFNPLLCFARRPTQTPEEVFDMLQERMITMLGHSYYEKGINLINWSPRCSTSFSEIEEISDWQNSNLVLTVKDFDRLGECVGLSITEVLGYPNVSEQHKKEIDLQITENDQSQGFSNSEYDRNGFDPASIFVILSSLDIIDEMATQLKELEAKVKC